MRKLLILLLFQMPFVAVFPQNHKDIKSGEEPPNFIFILADDLGWADVGCYGNEFNETPNIDALAAEGVRFTNAYAAAPVCSPYRAALMTGQYPARLGITDYLRPDAADHLDTSYTTIAEMFQKNGYKTGIIGKWHLSGYTRQGAPEETLPDKHGFDEVMISENRGIGAGSFFHPYHFNQEIEKKLPGKHEHLIDRQNQEAVAFIERNKEEPFFLYLSHYAVHTYVHGKPELVDYFRKKKGAMTSPPHKKNPQNDPYKKWPADFQAQNNNPHLAAQLFSIDQGVGMIMKKLKDLGIAKNTIVVFTSDNGGETNVTDNAPLRAGKSTLYEGGVRVPLVLWNPNDNKANAIEDYPVANYDFYPTFMDLVGAQPGPQEFDGISLMEIFKGNQTSLGERIFYWHYPLEEQHFLGGRSSGSIRKGDWKLIEFFDSGEKELYNLKKDLGEKNNLASRYPDKVQALLLALSAWREKMENQKL
ncbi:MAG: sulfatase [Fulvivirga sp.]